MTTKTTGDFIEVFDGMLDAATCEALVNRFKASDTVSRGKTGNGVETAIKNSWDIGISRRPEWADAEKLLNDAMMRGLIRYLRIYPYTILGPVWLKIKNPQTGETTMLDDASIAALPDQQLTALAMKAFRPGAVNLQRYLADEGGYPRWHCELYPGVDDATYEHLHRTLLWTIYLNDAFGEGETEFLHQGRKITPRTGSLVIAPAGFTHTHRGNMPRGGDKFIATSWVLFQRRETAFGGKP